MSEAVVVHVRHGCTRYIGRAFRQWATPSSFNPMPGRWGNSFPVQCEADARPVALGGGLSHGA